MKTKVFVFSVMIVFFYATNYNLSGKVKKISPGSYLHDYLEYTAENNPGLKAAVDQWKAGKESVAASGSLPDPVISFTYFFREIETKSGPQNFRAGIMQRFPWFGKLKLSSRIAAEKAEALRQNVQRVKLDLFYTFKKTYHDYTFSITSIDIIREHISLLEILNKQVETLYVTGLSSYSDMIRFGLELDRLRERERTLTERSSSLRTALNMLMDRPADAAVNTGTDREFPANVLDVKALHKIMLTRNPGLKMMDHLLLSGESGIKLQKKGFFPDISVGADIFSTGDAAVPETPGSGRDPFSVTVSLNLPLRLKKIHSAVRAAEFTYSGVKSEKANMENELASMLEDAVYQFNDSVRMIRLYRNKLVPGAKEVLEVKRAEFTAGRTTFIDLIDAQRTLLDFELLLEKAGTESLQRLALIEKLTGRSVCPDMEQEPFMVPEEK